MFEDEEENEEEKKITGEEIVQVLQDLKPVLDAIVVAIKGLAETICSNRVSYDEVMKYFIAHKDDSPEIAKGALLKEATGDGLEIIQVFLDKNNGLVTDSFGKPLGYKKKTNQLDDELLHLFKGNDLIIVE
jgi:hypothetical protein